MKRLRVERVELREAEESHRKREGMMCERGENNFIDKFVRMYKTYPPWGLRFGKRYRKKRLGSVLGLSPD
jgi:hypothetical protein